MVKELGPVRHILGWKLTCTPTSLTINQPAFAQQILHLFNMADCTPTSTPFTSTDLSARDSSELPLPKSTPFSAAVGCLLYLADSTGPDLSFIKGLLGRHTHDPCKRHWHAVQAALCYLRGTIHHGITYYHSELAAPMTAYADSDFASCKDMRRSTSGFVTFWRVGPISWQSKRQRFVTASKWEAEYFAGFQASKHLNRLRILLRDLTNHIPAPPTTRFLDNQSAITTANADYPTPKSKHKSHYLREQVSRRRITIHHFPTSNNQTEALRKSLKPAPFGLQVELLRLTPLPATTAATIV